MGRKRTNPLTLSQLRDGSWYLQGYINGNQIRLKSDNVGELEAKKIEYLKQLNESLIVRMQARMTRLTEDQIKDAEAAIERAAGRSLLECVIAAERVMPSKNRKLASNAFGEWMKALESRKRRDRTLKKNRLRISSFLRETKVQYLDEITAGMIEKWVFRGGRATNTQLTDATVLQSWLRFCAAPARRWLGMSPFSLDMEDLRATAKPMGRPKILTPRQCHRLLAEAAKYRNGVMLPFAVISTWCFLRAAEVCRATGNDIKLDEKIPIITLNPVKRGTPSYREVTVPENMVPVLRHCMRRNLIKKTTPIYYSRNVWDTIRERAGLIESTYKKEHKGKRRIKNLFWDENILRHTGISYLFQKTGDIKEVCRQAGNSTETSFAHYLKLPKQGACDDFYKPVVGHKDVPAPPPPHTATTNETPQPTSSQPTPARQSPKPPPQTHPIKTSATRQRKQRPLSEAAVEGIA